MGNAALWPTLPGFTLLQRDIDQPLMRIGGFPTRGCASYSDSGCRPFLKGLVALYRCMDFPVLGIACAGDERAALCHGPCCTLRHRHTQIRPLARSAPNRPCHNEVTAVVGDYGEGVNGLGTTFLRRSEGLCLRPPGS